MHLRVFTLLFLTVFVFSACSFASFTKNDFPYAKEEPITTPVVEPTSSNTDTPATDSTSSNAVPTVEAPQTTETSSIEEPTEPVSESTTATDITTAEPVTATETTETTSTVQTFTVVSSQFSFSPGTITVKKGDTVVINFSTTDVPHGFSLSDFNINLIAVNPNEVVTGTFVADKAGTFSFRCSVSCGTGHSTMTGTFIVEE